MTKKNLETRLYQTYHMADAPVRPDSLSTAAHLAWREARSRRRRIGFPQFLSMQIRFIGWKVWAVQGTSLLVICGLLSRLFGRGFWREPQSVAAVLFCLSVLVFMTAPPFLYRSVRYRMQEVEAAARFSSVRLLMARLIIIGTGDAVLLGGIVLTTAANSGLPGGSAVICVGFPFLMASSAGLYLLGHARPRRFLAGSTGLCVLLLLTLSQAARIGAPTPSLGWAGVCALLAAFCWHQFRYLLHHCAYAEMQIA